MTSETSHSHPVEAVDFTDGTHIKIRIYGCPGCIQDEFIEYTGSPQPDPVASDSPPIWELVIEDMKQRDRVGRERYGVPLQADNGRDALVDAYQEALDLAVYLRQAIEEIERRRA